MKISSETIKKIKDTIIIKYSIDEIILNQVVWIIKRWNSYLNNQIEKIKNRKIPYLY